MWRNGQAPVAACTVFCKQCLGLQVNERCADAVGLQMLCGMWFLVRSFGACVEG